MRVYWKGFIFLMYGDGAIERMPDFFRQFWLNWANENEQCTETIKEAASRATQPLFV